jgi:hypothetical protein
MEANVYQVKSPQFNAAKTIHSWMLAFLVRHTHKGVKEDYDCVLVFSLSYITSCNTQ